MCNAPSTMRHSRSRWATGGCTASPTECHERIHLCNAAVPGTSPSFPMPPGCCGRPRTRVPDHLAVVDRDSRTPFRALRDRAAAVAEVLAAAGVKPGDRVGIFLDRGLDAAAAFFGVLAAGAIAVNVNETLRTLQIDLHPRPCRRLDAAVDRVAAVAIAAHAGKRRCASCAWRTCRPSAASSRHRASPETSATSSTRRDPRASRRA